MLLFWHLKSYTLCLNCWNQATNWRHHFVAFLQTKKKVIISYQSSIFYCICKNKPKTSFSCMCYNTACHDSSKPSFKLWNESRPCQKFLIQLWNSTAKVWRQKGSPYAYEKKRYVVTPLPFSLTSLLISKKKFCLLLFHCPLLFWDHFSGGFQWLYIQPVGSF